MCIRKVERELDFNNEIEQLLSIDLSDDLTYIEGEIGISAVGYLYVNGSYMYHNDIREFEEMMEIDILAPYNKLSKNEEYNVSINDYDYKVINGNLKLYIDLEISGLSECDTKMNDAYEEENKDKKKMEKKVEHMMEHYEDITSSKLTNIVNNAIDDNKNEECACQNQKIIEVEELYARDEDDYIEKNDKCKKEDDLNLDFDDFFDEIVIEEDKKEDTNLEPIIIEEDPNELMNEMVYEVDEFDDILSDEQTTSCRVRYIIADEDTSYASLAKEYNCEAALIAKLNNYKPITARTLVEIPSK